MDTDMVMVMEVSKHFCLQVVEAMVEIMEETDTVRLDLVLMAVLD